GRSDRFMRTPLCEDTCAIPRRWRFGTDVGAPDTRLVAGQTMLAPARPTQARLEQPLVDLCGFGDVLSHVCALTAESLLGGAFENGFARKSCAKAPLGLITDYSLTS